MSIKKLSLSQILKTSYTAIIILVTILILPIINSTSLSKNSLNAFQAYAATSSSAQTNGVYPYGTEYPLGLYAINAEWPGASASGWNICHTYSTSFPTDTFINNCKNSGMLIMGRLDTDLLQNGNNIARSEASIAAAIDYLENTNNISWWDIPEEQRFWIASEMNIVQKYPAWTRIYDAKKLPNFMYIPGHYSAASIQKYVPYLDIIPASAYATYMGQPNTYVRWSIERTFQGIANAGYTIGKDYLNGEKTVMSIIELFRDNPGTSPEGSWHDFWLSAALDVKGILIYSHAYRNKSTNLQNCWAALSDAASKFSGSEQLNKVMLEGVKDNNINFIITSGPARTATFTPLGGSPTDYPSLTILGKKWKGNTYIIAVNSNTSSVSANITGLPIDVNTAEVLFENRNVQINNGTLSDNFKSLGVHIYKIAPPIINTPNPTQIISCQNTYLSDSAASSGYGLSWNPLTTQKELLIQVNGCSGNNASITVGSSTPNLYTYSKGYYWTGNSWQEYILAPSQGSIKVGEWIKGPGTGNIPLVQAKTFFTGHTCQLIGSTWKCGCNDSTCANPMWHLQGVQ